MTGRRRYGGTDSGLSYKAGADWRERAACATASPDEQAALTGGAGGNGQNTKPAKTAVRKYCDVCPVRTECFDWASGEPHFMGVAGGLLFGFETGKHYRSEHRRLLKL